MIADRVAAAPWEPGRSWLESIERLENLTVPRPVPRPSPGSGTLGRHIDHPTKERAPTGPIRRLRR
ncbi:MAG: hypothetical protein C0498_09275 [Anaerolinea sp.]|nr:hypothetical protein [Anaerolinea sp.]